eukprot:TRINITY_DN21858_c0_g1_i1.p1 TRINITY_DN21858_c0_g1~~TRINITY_DN21858_c0_g1_i1.p1  ORF type:complete len:137 (+),score=2.33 TRINITY_DN21858_c0_g1_i1:43-453(+)
MKLLILFSLLFTLFLHAEGVFGGLDCYSCSDCKDFEPTEDYVSRCPFGSQCLKISGTRNGESVIYRGCPWTSIFSSDPEEKCSSTDVKIPGLGEISGDVCLCSQDLCNAGSTLDTSIFTSTISAGLIILLHSWIST